MADEVVDVTGLAKADFVLGRVHVDVDRGRLDVEVEHERRIHRPGERVAEPDANRVADHVVAHAASVHEQELEVPAGPGGARRGQESVNRQVARVEGDLERARRELPSQQRARRRAESMRRAASITVRPSWRRVNETSGRARARRRTASSA